MGRLLTVQVSASQAIMLLELNQHALAALSVHQFLASHRRPASNCGGIVVAFPAGLRLRCPVSLLDFCAIGVQELAASLHL